MMKHDEAITLLEAYALGALDEEERISLQAHLKSGCAACTQELQELQNLADHLALIPDQQSPPPELKSSIMKKIKKVESPQTPSKPPIPVWWGWAAAAVVLVFFMIQGIEARKIKSKSTELATKSNRLRQENLELKQQISHYEREKLSLSEKLLSSTAKIATLEQQITRIEEFRDLLSSPGSQFFNLNGVDPNPQAFGKVIIDPIQGNAVVYVYRLPEPPDCMEYQLWVVRDGKPTSAGVFKVKKDGSTVLKLNEIPDPETIASFSVTIEPNGGQPVPTGMMYLISP